MCGKAALPRPEGGAGRLFVWLEAGSGKMALSRSRPLRLFDRMIYTDGLQRFYLARETIF
jgi:hypothetical protein